MPPDEDEDVFVESSALVINLRFDAQKNREVKGKKESKESKESKENKESEID